MVLHKFYVFLAVICSLMVIGQGGITTEKPQTIPIPIPIPLIGSKTIAETTIPKIKPVDKFTGDALTSSQSSFSDLETSPASSQEPETSSPPTTTSSTTEKTTTSTPTTNTSTTVPPTPEPKPTPAPGPLPPAKQGEWSYTDKSTNVTCILVQFAAQLNVTYPKVVNESTSLAYVLLNVPSNASVVDGSCNATVQWIQLAWPEDAANSMVLVFHSNETTKDYALKSLNVSLNPDVLVNSSLKAPVELWHGREWQVPLSTSFRCAPPTHLNMTAESASVVATLTFSQLQEEAFRTAKNSKTFSAARECGGGDLPDAVPIAVGCALGGLVLVVLIAYLEARRRSAARGYLSM